jgi:Spy/CpxP family protein refolding chaperone
MSDNRIRIWFSLFVLAVFCVGLAGGVLIGRRLSPDRVRVFRPPPGADFRGPMIGPGQGIGGGGAPAGRLVERLTRELDLTSDQRSKIEGVLSARRARFDTLQQEVRSKFEVEQESLRNEIRAFLTPEQQQKFDEREQELRSRFGGRRGPPR